MACSHGSAEFDIEEIYRKRDEKFNNINDETLPQLKRMVKTLFNFVSEEQEKDNFTVSKLRKNFTKMLNKVNKDSSIKGWIVSKPYLVYTYQKMIKENEIENDSMFWSMIQKCPTRTASGINSFAILLSDRPWKFTEVEPGIKKLEVQNFSCEHDCHFCPNVPGYSRSYVPGEPAVDRGKRHDWNPSNQLQDRLNSLLMQGHPLDKLELILEGGTYTEYPVEYLRDFNCQLFYTANTYFDKLPKRAMLSIEKEMENNKTTSIRIIGICIETRPDFLKDTEKHKFWVRFFRETGTTRIQLGVQHTDPYVLKRCNRGHTYEDSEYAADKLQDDCFKIDGQFMPDLPYSSYEKDIAMVDRIVSCGLWHTVKIYPFAVIPWTYFKKKIDAGQIELYSKTNPRGPMDIVKYALANMPYWQRCARAQRDIPSTMIEGGNNVSNTRQLVENELALEGIQLKEMRSREISRNSDYKLEDASYFCDFYKAGTGENCFIECASPDRKACFGFIRIRFPGVGHDPVFDVLKGRGLIQELHVYNNLVKVGKGKQKHSTQHRGIGKKLVNIAENIAWMRNKTGTAVITGEGVRGYYNKNGYYNKDTFAVKDFKIRVSTLTHIINISFILMIVFLGYLLS
jgi:elongator complex protein 3